MPKGLLKHELCQQLRGSCACMRSALPQDRLQREILPQGLRNSTVTQPSVVVSDLPAQLPSCLLFTPRHGEQAWFKAKISILKCSPAMRMSKGHSQKPLGTSVSLHVNHSL